MHPLASLYDVYLLYSIICLYKISILDYMSHYICMRKIRKLDPFKYMCLCLSIHSFIT